MAIYAYSMDSSPNASRCRANQSTLGTWADICAPLQIVKKARLWQGMLQEAKGPVGATTDCGNRY
jgi:hypothetical protein